MRRPAPRYHDVRTPCHDKNTEPPSHCAASAAADNLDGRNLHSSTLRLSPVIVVNRPVHHRHGDALDPLNPVRVGLLKRIIEVRGSHLQLRQLRLDLLQDVVPLLHGVEELINLLPVDVAAVREMSVPGVLLQIIGV